MEGTTVRESNIKSAIDEVNRGATQREAAAKYNVAQSTLCERLHGSTSKPESQLAVRRLSPLQESFLADWRRNEEAAGRGHSKAQITRMAQTILTEGGVFEPLGHRWADRFLRRHKSVKVKSSTLLESSRKRSSPKEKYEDFFRRLRHQIEVKKTKPRNIANMDEHGMQEQETIAGKVIGDSLTGRALVQSSDPTPWVTVIKCVTAEGQRLTPVVIFTGASLQGHWYPPFVQQEPELKDWKYEYSPTGWSNTEIGVKWLKEVYIPQTKPENPNDWRLLILDKHSTHDTNKFMLNCYGPGTRTGITIGPE